MATPGVARRQSTGASLLGFFALTFAVTETCFVTAAVVSRELPPGAPLAPGTQALLLLGTFAPGLVALGLTARTQGPAGVRALLARLFRWEVGGRAAHARRRAI